MAYLRYGRNTYWYIFWETSSAKSKEDERLAVWNIDHRASGPSFNYREVLDMLGTNNFERVPGFSARETDVLRRALQEFVEDVEAEYGQRAG